MHRLKAPLKRLQVSFSAFVAYLWGEFSNFPPTPAKLSAHLSIGWEIGVRKCLEPLTLFICVWSWVKRERGGLLT